MKSTFAAKRTGVVRIDGNLDEADWQLAPVATDFITYSPVFGQPAGSRTEVRILYDNTAIYIGAYLYDNPAQVRRQFTARDSEQNADVDFFSVFLDTYQDRQNAFQFLVTARNVQSDARVSPTVTPAAGVYGDLTWDAVWDSKVGFRDDGWVVEIKIPYFAIRFAHLQQQQWGIQFLRFNRRQNETSCWNPINPTIGGLVNQFGNLGGLADIEPPLRLSFSPYVSGGYRETPLIDEQDSYETLRSGGMDVKYGISESFTLDATLIPDFGQVISDNVVNNITPYEIQFRENRPFFTEGTELFNKAGIFYSRRIGKTPEQYHTIQSQFRSGTDWEVISNPSVTRLYNAVKFSGRTRNNLGIGVFNAITAPARARVRRRSTGKDSTIISEPLSNYNILVLDQALKNRSYITFTNTNVLRSGRERDANVAALDIALYDQKNMYGLLLQPRFSSIRDTSADYNGFANLLKLGKVSGKLQFNVSNELQSAKYDPNDLGYLAVPNKFVNRGEISYNIFEASPSFLNQRYGLSAEQSYLFEPFSYQKTKFEGFAQWMFHNFWELKLSTDIAPLWYNDYFELQTPEDLLASPRQRVKKIPYYSVMAAGSTDSRKRLLLNWSASFAETPMPNDPYYSFDISLRYRFSDRFNVTAYFFRQYDNGQFGYAFINDESTGAPILARRKYTDVTAVLSGIYNFTPRMNISFRARHFWNRMHNTNFYNVKPDGYWIERLNQVRASHNINYNAFNLDVFYTWDFRLGSRLVIGWKNWLGTDYEYAIPGSDYKGYTSNMRQMLGTPHGNELTVRFIYFLNYQ
ncbi:MAG: DUF5916 domain-containing protein [Candidatus Pseudobacter hemicellulosilyticus]|uniref:DUF5916 domain-containing protein n=1 Tax=Candidatus Pseudobacter hemicellulosilyticus TaxID=3121375 RepID=A0AAJ5WWP7_9BACT|nr:MAG: DUF5916 domain-containing protein [Pseudobacter sp.]